MKESSSLLTRTAPPPIKIRYPVVPRRSASTSSSERARGRDVRVGPHHVAHAPLRLHLAYAGDHCGAGISTTNSIGTAMPVLTVQTDAGDTMYVLCREQNTRYTGKMCVRRRLRAWHRSQQRPTPMQSVQTRHCIARPRVSMYTLRGQFLCRFQWPGLVRHVPSRYRVSAHRPDKLLCPCRRRHVPRKQHSQVASH